METTITRNIGLDFGFFKERLSGTIDVYWNTVKDLLVPSDIPGYTGYTKPDIHVGTDIQSGYRTSTECLAGRDERFLTERHL